MSDILTLRVTVLDTWEEVRLAVAPDTPVGEVKRLALTRAGVTASPDDYLVKFRGALVPENGTTVTGAGLVENAALIVLPRKRIPVR